MCWAFYSHSERAANGRVRVVVGVLEAGVLVDGEGSLRVLDVRHAVEPLRDGYIRGNASQYARGAARPSAEERDEVARAGRATRAEGARTPK